MTDELKVTITHEHDTTILKLVGEIRLDLDEADLHLKKVLAGKAPTVIIDAAKLTFLSSVGMKLLLSLRAELHRKKGHLKVVGFQPLVEEALRHARLLDRFEIHSTMASALAAQRP